MDFNTTDQIVSSTLEQRFVDLVKFGNDLQKNDQSNPNNLQIFTELATDYSERTFAGTINIPLIWSMDTLTMASKLTALSIFEDYIWAIDADGDQRSSNFHEAMLEASQLMLLAELDSSVNPSEERRLTETFTLNQDGNNLTLSIAFEIPLIGTSPETALTYLVGDANSVRTA